MNAILHAQIRATLVNHKEPYDITTLSVDKWLQGIDKRIIKMLATLIKPQRDSGKSVNEVYEDMINTQTNKLRCFYIVSVLMFCTNSQWRLE